jgi:hypothetical protein
LIDSISSDIVRNMDYCQICNIIRYSRTKHCRYCDACVSGFDHHCN